MASVWKHPKSQFWTACFTDKDGRRRKRSTKERERKKAERIADKLEAIARGKNTMRQVRRVIAELSREILGEELKSLKLADYVHQWVSSRKGEVSRATYSFYEGKSKRFLNFLKESGRGEIQLSEVTRDDVLKWRNAEGSRIAAKTVNHALKLLRMIFKQAKGDELIADNPTDSVKPLSTAGQRVARRPFSQEELELVLRNCTPEWHSMVLFGYCTSHRLSDIAMLTWRDLDLVDRKVRFVTRKTGAVAIVPMAEELFEHVMTLSAPDDPNTPVHAAAHAKLTADERTPELSNEFAEILVKAGLRREDWRKGSGAKGRRLGSALSFHSLRHTNISELQRAGVSAPVAGDLAGQKSAVITQMYTHMDEETKRAAIQKLPRTKVKRSDGQLEFEWGK